MPITITLLQAFVNLTADQSSYVSAGSYSPPANAVLFLNVGSKIGTGTPPTPTITGGGVSEWTLVNSVSPFTGRRHSVFRAETGSSPGSGTIGFDYGGTTIASMQFQLIQVTGTKRTGTNGADAIVQETNATKGTSSGVNLPMSLASPWDNADNIALACFYVSSTTAITGGIDTGFTLLNANGSGSGDNTGSLGVIYGRDGSDLEIGATIPDGGIKSGIGFELAIYEDPTVPIVQRAAYATRQFGGRLNN